MKNNPCIDGGLVVSPYVCPEPPINEVGIPSPLILMMIGVLAMRWVLK